MNEVYKEFFTQDFPARAAIQVCSHSGYSGHTGHSGQLAKHHQPYRMDAPHIRSFPEKLSRAKLPKTLTSEWNDVHLFLRSNIILSVQEGSKVIKITPVL